MCQQLGHGFLFEVLEQSGGKMLIKSDENKFGCRKVAPLMI
jgi:hypothetical protein